MKVRASPEAEQFVKDHGGRLFVWADVARCCSGALTFLEAATETPRRAHDFERTHLESFDLFADFGRRPPPDEIDVEMKGWPRRHLRAFWNGCVYAMD